MRGRQTQGNMAQPVLACYRFTLWPVHFFQFSLKPRGAWGGQTPLRPACVLVLFSRDGTVGITRWIFNVLIVGSWLSGDQSWISSHFFLSFIASRMLATEPAVCYSSAPFSMAEPVQRAKEHRSSTLTLFDLTWKWNWTLIRITGRTCVYMLFLAELAAKQLYCVRHVLTEWTAISFSTHVNAPLSMNYLTVLSDQGKNAICPKPAELVMFLSAFTSISVFLLHTGCNFGFSL